MDQITYDVPIEELLTVEALLAQDAPPSAILSFGELMGFTSTQEALSFSEAYQGQDMALDFRAVDIFDPEEHKLYGTPGENRGAKHKKCGAGKKLCGTRCIPADRNCRYDESHKTVESQKFSVRETIGLSNSVPRALRDKMVKKFPKIFEEGKHEKFFWHLMYSAHTTSDGTVIIPRDVLYKFAGNRDGETFLKEFSEVMGETPRAKKPYFNYTDYSYKYGRAREAEFNLPQSIKDQFMEDLRSTVQSKDRVFALGGATYNKENIGKVRKIQKELAIEVANSLDNPDQKKVALYHANQTPADMPRYNFRQAYTMAEQLKLTRGEDSSKTAYRQLNAIRANPVGYYRPSRVTTRMFSANHIQGLSSSVRAALIPEMAEMDLVSAHFAIIADKTKDPRLDELMKRIHELKAEDKSVWDEFAADFNKAGYPWNPEVKKLVKEQFFALAYGGQNSGVQRRLWMAASDFPDTLGFAADKEFRDTLFANEYFQALYKAGEGWRKKMLEDGYGCNAYGKCFEVKDAKQSRSVMSAVNQSYESKLITAMYPDDDKDEELMPYQIIYNGFDGLGIIPKPGRTLEDVNNYMNRRLEKVKRETNLPNSRLDIKMGKEAALDEDELSAELLEELENSWQV
jgi:hypothetical protein